MTHAPQFSSAKSRLEICNQLQKLDALEAYLEAALGGKFDIADDSEEPSYAWHSYPVVSPEETKKAAKAAMIDLIRSKIRECESSLVSMGFAKDTPKLLEAPVTAEPA